MSTTVYIPSAPLSAYIKCMWYCERYWANPAVQPRRKVFPMPSLHLMVNFGDAYPIYVTDHTKPNAVCNESWWVGFWNTHHTMDSPLDMQILNVSFKPGGAYPFLQFPLSELTNQIVPLDVIWGNFAAELRDRLYAAPTAQARFVLMEQLLLARLGDASSEFNPVQYSIERIAVRQGTLSIRALSDHLGISHKHLITQFKRFVGGTPKALARLYRFRHILDTIDPTQAACWTDIAHQFCYHDQSHFNKDFEAFSGLSPTAYLQLRRRKYAANPEHDRYVGSLPLH